MLRTRARDCLLVCGGGLVLLAEGLFVAWVGLLVWVWVLFGDGGGWPGVGSCGAGWGV